MTAGAFFAGGAFFFAGAGLAAFPAFVAFVALALPFGPVGFAGRFAGAFFGVAPFAFLAGGFFGAGFLAGFAGFFAVALAGFFGAGLAGFFAADRLAAAALVTVRPDAAFLGAAAFCGDAIGGSEVAAKGRRRSRQRRRGAQDSRSKHRCFTTAFRAVAAGRRYTGRWRGSPTRASASASA